MSPFHIGLAIAEFIDVIPAQEFYLLGDPPFRFFGTEAVRHSNDD
jgi:hypothetical protein